MSVGAAPARRATALRPAAKQVAEAAAVGLGLARVGRWLRRRHSLVLSYHDVVADGGAAAPGDASLHLRRADFAAQLDALAAQVDVVPLEALLQGGAPRDGGGRLRVALTFDDAYLGAVTHGVEELARRGLPATICVAPGRLGDDGFWWDRLGVGGAVRADVREHALDALAGDDPAVLAWARDAGHAVAAPDPRLRPATAAELRAALRVPGMTMAAHSWTHPNLARVAAERLRHELEAPLAWARRERLAMLPVLTYPYGRWSDAVVAASCDAGYRAAFLVEGGASRAARRTGADPGAYRWPRLNVPAGLSPRGFAMRVAGLL